MSNKVILLVEDDEEDQLLIKSALEALNCRYDLIIVDNGEEALNFLRTTSLKVFLILSDMNMPRVTGLDLMREISKDNFLKKKSIPFVFLSTAAAPKDIEEAYGLGVQGYFRKPHSFGEIEKYLEMIIVYWERCRHPSNP